VTPVEGEKRAAAEAAAELVPDGGRVGLGTGTTVAYLLPALARRRLRLRCVATSPTTEHAARELGLAVDPFEEIAELDVAIDGADQVAPSGWLVKGGGGAHTREKVVAAAARRFIVIVSADKDVEQLSGPVPLELLRFGLRATLRAVTGARLRPDAPPTADHGVLADLFGADLREPGAVAARLAATPGIVDHGLFGPDLVADVLLARGDEVERRVVNKRS
jgi:ribose 5-phosphate isomerase A